MTTIAHHDLIQALRRADIRLPISSQIFFAITHQIVCEVALTKAEKLQAQNVGEFVANQFLIKVIGVAGIFPVVLDLCTRYRQKQFLDWSVPSISSCCVLLATVTWSEAMSVFILSDQLFMGEGPAPRDCGPMDPMKFCISPVALHPAYECLLELRGLTLFDRVFFLSGTPVALALFAFLTLVATRIENSWAIVPSIAK